MKKINFKKWKSRSKEISLKIAEKAFKSFLILFLIALIIGGILFYKYSFLVERKEPQADFQQIIFKEDNFKNILEIWGQREKDFEQADAQDFQDLFSAPEEIEEEEI